MTGALSGAYSSDWGVPDGPGEWTPPAVSTNSHPGPAAARRETCWEMRARRASSEGMGLQS